SDIERPPQRPIDRSVLVYGVCAPARLFVIADTATKVARLGNEGHLGNRRPVGTWPGKHIVDLGDLTFRLLRGVIELRTKHFSGWVLKGPGVSPNQLLYGGYEPPVTEVEAEWIEVAVLKAVCSFVELRQRHKLVRLYS